MGKYLDILARAGDCDKSDKSDKSPPPARPIDQQAALRTPFGRLNRFCRTYSSLEARCPDLVPIDRWRAAVDDGRRFLARWGEQAEVLGWTAKDLFGLHQPPANPHPNYSRLSRYDEIGLIWLLRGREVVALTEATAAIQSSTGAITIYRRHNKPAPALRTISSMTSHKQSSKQSEQ
jgi:hypothetical protein